MSGRHKLAVAIGMSWGLFLTIPILGIPVWGGDVHIEWWQDGLARLVVAAGVLIPLCGGDVLGRIRHRPNPGKPMGKTAKDL